MNNNVNKPNSTPIRACLLSIIPKRNSAHLGFSDVWERMSKFLAENKRLEVVYDFNKENDSTREVYQDKIPHRLDATKVIKKMRSLDCDVLIIPTFASLADNPEICSDILMELHEANIRIVSPYDAFDSKIISNQVDKETAELFKDLRAALSNIFEKCVVRNVDDFMDYVEKTKFKHRNASFRLVFGNKALIIPYSEDICAEIFDFLDILDEEYLRPELYAEDEFDDDDEDDDIPDSEYDEPLVERDFEG